MSTLQWLSDKYLHPPVSAWENAILESSKKALAAYSFYPPRYITPHIVSRVVIVILTLYPILSLLPTAVYVQLDSLNDDRIDWGNWRYRLAGPQASASDLSGSAH